MAHDIGNMSQIAMGYLEIAEGTLRSSPDRDTRTLAMLAQSTETLNEISRLINNIRKTQVGKAEAKAASPINIGDLLERVRTQYQNIPGREVKITIDRKCSCIVMANDLLSEVFSNIVGNSIKHSQGRINIAIAADHFLDRGKKFCRISIEDDGPGIPDPVKEEILHSRAARHKGGRARGLGICLTRMLIGEFHGQFRLEDRVPGDYTRGLRAVVVLPAK